MRIFLRLIFLSTGAILFPFFIMLVAPQINGFSHDVIKDELKAKNIYGNLADMVQEQAASTIGDEDATSRAVVKSLENEFSTAYVEQKVNTAIDDTTLWITGKSDTLPVISFVDVKDRILEKNPQIAKDFEQLSAQAKTAQTTVSQDQNSLDHSPDATKGLPDLATLMQNDFTLPIGEYLEPVKTAYTVYRVAMYVVGIAWLLSIIGVIFTAKTLALRFLWFGITLIISGISGFLGMAFSGATLLLAFSFLARQTNDVVRLVLPSVERIVDVLLQGYMQTQTYSSATMFIFGISSLVAYLIAKKKQVTKPNKI